MRWHSCSLSFALCHAHALLVTHACRVLLCVVCIFFATVSLQNDNMSTALQFADAIRRLNAASTGVLQHRWSILYVLQALSQSQKHAAASSSLLFLPPPTAIQPPAVSVKQPSPVNAHDISEVSEPFAGKENDTALVNRQTNKDVTLKLVKENSMC